MAVDHDQRFKVLIQSCFAEFMRLFFAEWADHFDFEHIQWLPNEAYAVPPDGQRKLLDLVAKMKLLKPFDGMVAEEGIVVVHCEIDSSGGTVELKTKMPYYYFPLRFEHKCPVLPIALFLKVGLDGIGVLRYEERFGSLTPLKFEFLYVGLPGLKALEYVKGENILGVALSALMDIPEERVVELGAEALKRIQDSDLTDQRKFLLGECFEAYLPLDEEQEKQLEGILRTNTRSEVKAMRLTSYEKGQLSLMAELLEEKLDSKYQSEGTQWLAQLPADTPVGKLKQIYNAIDSAPTLSALKERTGME